MVPASISSILALVESNALLQDLRVKFLYPIAGAGSASPLTNSTLSLNSRASPGIPTARFI